MYIALFIIMDLLILALLLIAVFFLLHKLREIRERERPTFENDLEEFRNEGLHEEARLDKERMAHIEEVAASRSLTDSPNREESEE